MTVLPSTTPGSGGPLRVLYVNPFSQAISGPDESLLELLKALVPLGVQPHVVLPHPGPQVSRFEERGAVVHFVPLSILKRRVSPYALGKLSINLVRGTRTLFDVIRKEQIQLVHTNMEVVLDAGIAAKLARIPHVMHYRGNTLDEPRLLFDALTLAWVKTSGRILCISRSTADIFVKRGHGNHIQVVYNPVNTQALSLASRSEGMRSQFGASPTDLLVGAIGRIHPRKDLTTFLRAAAAVIAREPRARFVVVGGAEAPEEHAYRADLENLVTELGLANRLTWAGVRRDIPSVLKALDVMVLSSRHEGFGRVVAEAMAAGTPVVASREGAMPELIQDGVSGLLANPGDSAEFATCICRLLETEELRSSIGAAAKRAARLFSPELVAGQVLETYRHLLGLPSYPQEAKASSRSLQ